MNEKLVHGYRTAEVTVQSDVQLSNEPSLVRIFVN
jgi:hypothetical protein